MQHGEEMKRQDEKTPFKRVGNRKLLVENGKPRLRHNRAIEFRRVRSMAAPFCQGMERVQRTARFV
jgi:hypothetical protein